MKKKLDRKKIYGIIILSDNKTKREEEMKAVVAEAIKNLKYYDIEEPQIYEGCQIKIKILKTGICGSDLHFIHGTLVVSSFPKIIGHELIGEVVGVGSDVKEHALGSHVVVKVGISCGSCYACKKGRDNACSSLRSRGTSADGVFCEYIVVNEEEAYTVPKSIALEDAVLLEPYSIAGQITTKSNCLEGDIALIIGAGTVGLTVVDVLTHIYNVRCIVTDIADEKLEKARKIGAAHTINTSKIDMKEELKKFTGDGMVNISIDSACTQRTFEEAVQLTSSAGTVVVVGFNPNPSAISQLDITKKELVIAGSRQQTGQFPKVIDWMEKGLLHPELVRTHSFSCDNVIEAVDLLGQGLPNVGKVIIDWE